MRSSTLATLAILIASSPAFAAPTYPAKGPGFIHKTADIDAQQRKLAEIIARENDLADESGAVNWGKAFNVASGIGGAAGLLGSLIPGHDDQKQQKREELLELLARQNDADASGAANWGKIFNVVSGVGGAAGLLGSLAGNHDQQQKREEIIELLSRQSSTDDSGAANWGKILNIAGGVGSATSLLGSLIPNHDQQPPKRAEALIARQQGEADSGAANWGKVADVGSKVISGLGTAAGIGGTGVSVWDKLHGGQKREDLVKFLAREDPFDSLIARAPPSKVGTALDQGNQVLGGVSGMANLAHSLIDHLNKQKREELVEFLARQDANGGTGDLDINDIVNKVTSFLGIKRQETSDGAGDLDVNNIIHKVTSFLGFKREDVTDESGAFDFGKLVKNVAGLILKRDDVSDSEALSTLADLFHGKREPFVSRPGMHPITHFPPGFRGGMKTEFPSVLNQLD